MEGSGPHLHVVVLRAAVGLVMVASRICTLLARRVVVPTYALDSPDLIPQFAEGCAMACHGPWALH